MEVLRKYHLCVLFLLLTIGNLAAQDSLFDGNFPHIGYGARALALGEAYTAVADDLSALYWNPAGLVQLNGNEVFSQKNELARGLVNQSIIGVGLKKLLGGTLAASWRRISPSSQLYSYAENTFSLGIARGSGPLGFGLTTKGYHSFLLSDDQGDETWGLGLDLGLLMKSKLGNFGFAIRDLLSYLNYGDSTGAVAREYSVGYALHKADFTLVLGLDKQSNETLFKVGCEQHLFDNIKIRFGRKGDSWSGGVGFSFQNINLDYAYYSVALEGLNIFSFRWIF